MKFNSIPELFDYFKDEQICITYVVQADESYFGGKEKNKHKDKRAKNAQGRSLKDKTPVVGLYEKNGKVIAFVVPNTEGKT